MKTEYVDNMINSYFETQPEEEETLLEEIAVEEEPVAEIEEPVMVEEPIEEVIEEPEVTLELEPEPEEEIPEVLEEKEEEAKKKQKILSAQILSDLSAFEPVSSLEEEPLPKRMNFYRSRSLKQSSKSRFRRLKKSRKKFWNSQKKSLN